MIQGSPDNQQWYTLGEVSGNTQLYREFDFPANTGYYKYHRFITTDSGSNSYFSYIADLSFEAYYKDGADPMDSTWASPASSKYLIKAWEPK